MDNLEEMEKLLEMYNLPRLNQEEIKHVNRQITSNEIESVIKKTPNKQKFRTGWFTGEFYQTFKEELTPTTYPSQTISKIAGKGKLPNSFYKASITLIINQRHHKNRKLQASIVDQHICKHSQKILASQIQEYFKSIIHHQVGFIPGMQEWFSIHKSINMIHHINKLKINII